jgi:hypothetical protein
LSQTKSENNTQVNTIVLWQVNWQTPFDEICVSNESKKLLLQRCRWISQASHLVNESSVRRLPMTLVWNLDLKNGWQEGLFGNGTQQEEGGWMERVKGEGVNMAKALRMGEK